MFSHVMVRIERPRTVEEFYDATLGALGDKPGPGFRQVRL